MPYAHLLSCLVIMLPVCGQFVMVTKGQSSRPLGASSSAPVNTPIRVALALAKCPEWTAGNKCFLPGGVAG